MLFSPENFITQIDQRYQAGQVQNIVHPASSWQHLRVTASPFLLKGSAFFPTYFMEPHRSAQKVSKRPQAESCWPSACLSPPSLPSLRDLYQSDTLHILWCRTMNLATLSLQHSAFSHSFTLCRSCGSSEEATGI